MHILFLSRWFPFPANNGSKLRISQLIEGTSRYHSLTLLSFIEPDESPTLVSPAQVSCRAIHTIARKPFNPTSKTARLGFLSPTPRSVIDTYSPEMANRIRQIITQEKPDLVIASQFDMAVYHQSFQGLPAIFEEVETAVLYEQFTNAQGLRRKLRFGLTWQKHSRYLKKILNSFTACTVVSQKERELLVRIAPDSIPIVVLPNFLSLSRYAGIGGQPKQKSLIFTGSFSYFANYEAAMWFVEQVWPIILAHDPEIELVITGDRAGKPLPAVPGLRHIGFVDDIRPHIAGSWISLSPILSGGGTRLKILEAMALGTPVVSTSKGAEGLDAVPEQHLLVADQPGDFAAAVLRLVNQPSLRQQISESALKLVTNLYSAEAVLPNFLSLIESMRTSNRSTPVAQA